MKKLLATVGMIGLFSFNIGQMLAVAPQAPTITSITPSSGPTAGGTSVTIAGTHLTGVSVTIGGVAATNVVVAANAQSLTATTPANGPAAEDVVVANSNGTSTLEGGFTYTNATSTPPVTQYTLTYSAGANGIVAGSTTQVVNASSSGTSVTAAANLGFHFVNWSDASTSNPRTDTNVSGNLTVTANFAEDTPSSPSNASPCNASTFDTFATGTVNGQGGWHVSGTFDQEVIPNYLYFGYPTFGCQTLRISDAMTSVFIYNQIFSNGATNEAGETDAFSGDTPIGTRQNHFEAQFDLGTALQTEQPGLHMSVSPDRGDGTRMSSVGIIDTADGLDVYFQDVTGTTSPVTFNETQIANNLSRIVPHTIKFVMDFVDGPSNDVVKVYIDGSLAHTGTSWENFYRYDNDAYPAPSPNSRTVNGLVFYEPGTSNSGNNYNGFVVDNVSITSTTTTSTSTPPNSTSTPPTSTSTPPVITLNGSSTMNIVQHSVFTDPGATATDDIDGTVAVTATGTVNTAVLGAYIRTYTATDSNNNTASTTRTVNVVATSSVPIVTLNGTSSVNVMQNTAFTDPGATATDQEDGTLTVTRSGALNTDVLGDYTLTYSATDSNGNTATATRVVHVIAGQPSGGGGGGGGGGGFVFSPLPGFTSPIISTNPSTGGNPITIATVSTPTGEVLGVAVFNFKRNMKIGSTGDDVQELQKYLISQGYLVLKNATKYFGPLTHNALKKWQKARGLPSTGFFGPMSRAEIVR